MNPNCSIGSFLLQKSNLRQNINIQFLFIFIVDSIEVLQSSIIQRVVFDEEFFNFGFSTLDFVIKIIYSNVC